MREALPAIRNVDALRELPVLADSDQAALTLVGPAWRKRLSGIEARLDGLGVPNWQMVFHNGTYFAIERWNRRQSFLGRMMGNLFASGLGYVAMPRSVLLSALADLGQFCDLPARHGDCRLRLDFAADFCGVGNTG